MILTIWEAGESGQWAVAEGAQTRLRELAARGDIIRTIGAALREHGQDRPLDSYAVVTSAPEKPIAGRLIDKGLHDELYGAAYAVIDGTDGRTHHVRLPGIEALEHSPKLGGIVELRAIGRPGALWTSGKHAPGKDNAQFMLFEKAICCAGVSTP